MGRRGGKSGEGRRKEWGGEEERMGRGGGKSGEGGGKSGEGRWKEWGGEEERVGRGGGKSGEGGGEKDSKGEEEKEKGVGIRGMEEEVG